MDPRICIFLISQRYFFDFSCYSVLGLLHWQEYRMVASNDNVLLNTGGLCRSFITLWPPEAFFFKGAHWKTRTKAKNLLKAKKSSKNHQKTIKNQQKTIKKPTKDLHPHRMKGHTLELILKSAKSSSGCFQGVFSCFPGFSKSSGSVFAHKSHRSTSVRGPGQLDSHGMLSVQKKRFGIRKEPALDKIGEISKGSTTRSIWRLMAFSHAAGTLFFAFQNRSSKN